MRWLVHGSKTTSAVANALRRHGHAVDSLDPSPLQSSDDFFRVAHQKQLDVITTDSDLASSAAQMAGRFDRSIVFLQVEGGDVEQDDAVDRLFERYKRLSPRRLYTVTGSRVKVKQLPGAR